MKLPEKGSQGIEKYRNDSEIIRLTAEQVIKDFELFGIKIEFSGDIINAYDELFEQLNFSIAGLLSYDYSKLLSLLYHIDINEKEIAAGITASQDASAEIITGLILDRELIKVITRKFYRG